MLSETMNGMVRVSMLLSYLYKYHSMSPGLLTWFQILPLVLSTILHGLFSKGVWLWVFLNRFYLFAFSTCLISFQAFVFSPIFKVHFFYLMLHTLSELMLKEYVSSPTSIKALTEISTYSYLDSLQFSVSPWAPSEPHRS